MRCILVSESALDSIKAMGHRDKERIAALESTLKAIMIWAECDSEVQTRKRAMNDIAVSCRRVLRENTDSQTVILKGE
jgi:hypothetical protein